MNYQIKKSNLAINSFNSAHYFTTSQLNRERSAGKQIKDINIQKFDLLHVYPSLPLIMVLRGIWDLALIQKLVRLVACISHNKQIQNDDVKETKCCSNIVNCFVCGFYHRHPVPEAGRRHDVQIFRCLLITLHHGPSSFTEMLMQPRQNSSLCQNVLYKEEIHR